MRRLADTAQATVERLDILINNAGIDTAGARQTSAEGFELRFAVNYLAGFLLTLLLLPLIKKNPRHFLARAFRGEYRGGFYPP